VAMLASSPSLWPRPTAAMSRRSRLDPYSHVDATIEQTSNDASTLSTDLVTQQSKKFLLASFPTLRQVAYAHLPDNVWRPLVLGEVSEPTGIAVDMQTAKLFVSDPPNQVIWWYQLNVNRHGLLETVGSRKAAVEGVNALWLTVNGVGDLYFTGRLTSASSQHDSVFRQDAASIAAGRSRTPTEVYTRSNTGNPNPKVWEPSGIAVDALFVYWGNKEGGTKHGAVVKGSRMNVGLLSQDRQLKALSTTVDEVRGMVATGTHVFYLSNDGVHGVLKTAAQTAEDANLGLIAKQPATTSSGWNPTGITWDGDNTLYFTDLSSGIVYTVPALNILEHNVTKYADAPGARCLAVVGFSGGSSAMHSSASRRPAPGASLLRLLVAPALFFILAAAAGTSDI